MRAITIRQPWATLIAIGAKRIETRSWPTSYRGPALIHAGKSTEDLSAARSFSEWAGPMWAPFTRPNDLPFGAVVAVADLVDCVDMTPERIERVSPDERRFGHYEPGHYMWHLDNVRSLDKFVPAKGRLGLWRPDAELVAAVQEAMVA